MADLIQQLIDQSDDGFQRLLAGSLQQANDIARHGGRGMEPLDADLYQALRATPPKGELGWPTDFGSYIEYLRWFYRWTPQQSGHEGWKRPGTSEYQEAYDRLCHFYWLVDQPVGDNGSVMVQNIPWFSEWLVAYASAWGEYLDTPESFNDEILQGFADDPWYSLHDYMIRDPQADPLWRPNAPSGWLTFNQFFARELNPGLRPIAEPTRSPSKARIG
jgi:phosphatidylserine decarboxylase